jgi:hypothetical protein
MPALVTQRQINNYPQLPSKTFCWCWDVEREGLYWNLIRMKPGLNLTALGTVISEDDVSCSSEMFCISHVTWYHTTEKYDCDAHCQKYLNISHIVTGAICDAARSNHIVLLR